MPGVPVVSDAQRRQKRRLFLIYLLLMGTAAVILLLYWWSVWRGHETTDDAFVDGHIAQIAPQVAGRVTTLAVADNQPVKRGDLLMTLDSRDYQVALQKAIATRQVDMANLAQARADILARQATVAQDRANVQLAEANLARDRKEHARYLHSGRAVTVSDLDSKAASEKTSAASLLAAQKGADYSQAELEKSRAALTAAQATVRQDDASVAEAELNLGYTRLYAPFDGYVTRRDAEIGDYVTAGSVAMRVVSTQMWVTANFKENQLQHMRPGQPVQIRVDAFPDRQLSGRVESIQRATGSVFTLLPAENATGNYVKIVQRIPVKIVLDPPPASARLSPGMSVVPTVDVR